MASLSKVAVKEVEFKMLKYLAQRISILLGLLLGLQIPHFMNQYQHQLIGHVTELQLQVDQLEAFAKKSDKSLDQYIHKFIQHTDPDFARHGNWMKEQMIRLQRLKEALFRLETSSGITRFWNFLSTLNWDIFKSTLSSFQIGLILNLESIAYGSLGVLLGLFFCLVFWRNVPSKNRN